jgi:hypothetical protein
LPKATTAGAVQAYCNIILQQFFCAKRFGLNTKRILDEQHGEVAVRFSQMSSRERFHPGISF